MSNRKSKFGGDESLPYKAREAALRILSGHTVGDVSPVGPLKSLKDKEKKQLKKVK